MDANGTRFHLILGREDWLRCRVDGVSLADWEASSSPLSEKNSGFHFNDEQSVLTLQPELFRFRAAPKDNPPQRSNRRGAGRDKYENWYWIDESSTRIRVFSSGSGRVSNFWSPELDSASRYPNHSGDFQAAGDFQSKDERRQESISFAGLAVTEDHYLVVGVIDPPGLLVFDLHTTGAPRQILWPGNAPFVPFDMSPRKGGGVWILDRQHRCYWALDRYFNVEGSRPDPAAANLPGDFESLVTGNSIVTNRSAVPRNFTSNLASLVAASDPFAIEGLPDGTVLILDGEARIDSPPNIRYSRIYHYCFERQLGDPLTTEVMLSLAPEEDADLNFEVYDIAFVPAHEQEDGTSVSDRLYAATVDGNQVFAFSVSGEAEQLSIKPVEEYFPMRLFGGRGLVAADFGAYYDFRELWLPLVRQGRPRYVTEATLETPVLDGKEPDCIWHRLLIDACIPVDAEIGIETRAANNERDLQRSAWQQEPPVYLRTNGSELPFLSSAARTEPETRNIGTLDGTWELLFQRARGRFMQLRIRVSGNGRTSPRLKALRAYYPRFSYLNRYLPAVYREDDQSASFLDRFLSNFEGFFTTLEDRIAAVQILFDVRSAPPETLEWLAWWFGFGLDKAWNETKRRVFIRHAMEFFQYRGTAHGIRIALHLALSDCVDESLFSMAWRLPKQLEGIRIIEKYRTRKTPGVVFGDPDAMSGPRRITTAQRWEPRQGRDALNIAYEKFAASAGGTSSASIEFPISAPADAAERLSWRKFAQATLGFVPALGSGAGDLARWQDFLARRYRQTKALNRIYGTSYTSFQEIPLPTRLPPDGAPVVDWYQFEGVVTVMHQTAHRFDVLLPVPKSTKFIQAEQRQRLDLARRIVNLEKPAHTTFEVRFYWAMFRVGQARLGEDTLIDLGSRSPELMPRMVLGQGALGEGSLAPTTAEAAADRNIIETSLHRTERSRRTL